MIDLFPCGRCGWYSDAGCTCRFVDDEILVQAAHDRHVKAVRRAAGILPKGVKPVDLTRLSGPPPWVTRQGWTVTHLVTAGGRTRCGLTTVGDMNAYPAHDQDPQCRFCAGYVSVTAA